MEMPKRPLQSMPSARMQQLTPLLQQTRYMISSHSKTSVFENFRFWCPKTGRKAKTEKQNIRFQNYPDNVREGPS